MNNHIDNNLENFQEEEPFDFQGYLDKLLGYWWFFLISILVFTGIAYVYSKHQVPAYRVTAKILVEDEKKGGAGFSATAILGEMNEAFNMKSNVDNEVEVLKTNAMAEKAVRKLNLYISYYSVSTFITKELYNAPFTVEILSNLDSVGNMGFEFQPIDNKRAKLTFMEPFAEEKSTKEITYDKPFLINEIGVMRILKNPLTRFDFDTYKFNVNSINLATIALQGRLGISVTNKLVTTIDLSLDHTIPQKGKEILKALIEGYIEQSIIDKNRIADSTIKFIENRLLLVSEELGDIEGDIQFFKQENQLADISEQSKLLVENTSEYAREIAQLETQIDIANALEEYLTDKQKNQRAVPSFLIEQDLVFAKLVESYNMLLLERDKQLLTSTEQNPYIRNLDERIASLRAAMLSNIGSTKNSMVISLRQVRKKMDMLGGQIRKVPAHERAYLNMFRQQTLKQELYLFLLKKREETALSKTSNFSNSKIIDPPRSAPTPHKPNKKVILLMGFALGLALPFAFIYVKDLLNNKVQGKEDIVKKVEVPILGEISHSESEDGFTYKNPKSVISEQFRALRTNLAFYLNSTTENTILLTSSMSGEGKTFIAINLGTILAISGKRVLIVDLDLRKASLSQKLGLKSARGFTNYILGEQHSIDDIVVQSQMHEQLFIMPAGPFPPNPAETLLDAKTDALIQQLKQKYDYVLLDAPPIGVVTDAQLLDKFASITLYLVRQEYTLKSQLNIPMDLSRQRRMKKMGIILNDVVNSKSSAYGYGYYVKEDQPHLNWFTTMRKRLFGMRS